jgi:hypothetical protein
MPQIARVFRRRGRIPPSDSPAPRAVRINWSESAILGGRSAAARDLADLVAARMVGSTLPWSDRKFIFRQASARHIGRFEANLIIAAVQNHLARKFPVAESQSLITHRRRIPIGILTFCAVQGAIITLAWRLLFS